MLARKENMHTTANDVRPVYIVWAYSKTSRKWLCDRFYSIDEANAIYAKRVANGVKVKAPRLSVDSRDPNTDALLLKFGAVLSLISLVAFLYLK